MNHFKANIFSFSFSIYWSINCLKVLVWWMTWHELTYESISTFQCVAKSSSHFNGETKQSGWTRQNRFSCCTGYVFLDSGAGVALEPRLFSERENCWFHDALHFVDLQRVSVASTPPGVRSNALSPMDRFRRALANAQLHFCVVMSTSFNWGLNIQLLFCGFVAENTDWLQRLDVLENLPLSLGGQLSFNPLWVLQLFLGLTSK